MILSNNGASAKVRFMFYISSSKFGARKKVLEYYLPVLTMFFSIHLCKLMTIRVR